MSNDDLNREFSLRTITSVLVQRGLLTSIQARQALEREPALRAEILRSKVSGLDARRASRHTVGPTEVLARQEFRTPDGRALDEDLIMMTLAQAMGLAFEKPDPLKLDAELITSTMKQAYARRHSCVPLRRHNGKVVLAVSDPSDRQMLETLALAIPGGYQMVLSAKSDIQRIITEVYGFRSSVSAAAEQHGGSTDIGNLEQLSRMQNVEKLEATDEPIINAVQYLLHYAFTQRASDIHIEPKRKHSLVRLRIDGILHNIYTLPKPVHAPLISRIKLMARMDIAEKRRPQGGRIKMALSEREVELRVSSLPVAFGEKIVIRVFDPQALIQELDNVGFYREDLDIWRTFINQPNGMVLVTGPTGSGKTTTLYSTLKELAGPDRNITTVEDPIEMIYEEFNQVLVQRRIELDFAQALRTILRQDPDVIMIGEIRDPETARMATQAALTGHLVFSTLHTNDTASTVTRLIDLEAEPFLLSSTLRGVVAQRLLRRICTHCAQETTLTPEQIELLGLKFDPREGRQLPVKYGEGCIRCRNTGYLGRTGIFELLQIDGPMRKLISQGAGSTEIRKAAVANDMMTLKDCAIRKMAEGVTTFEEVMTVMTD